MHLHAALITLLTALLLMTAMGLVGRARGKFQVHAPAVNGPPGFERVFRAHQNSNEQALVFLPTLWVASVYGNEQWAAWAGYAWLVARVWYLAAYMREGGNRGPGFTLASIAWVALWLIALVGVGRALLA
jgi:glutathione S-transferase